MIEEKQLKSIDISDFLSKVVICEIFEEICQKVTYNVIIITIFMNILLYLIHWFEEILYLLGRSEVDQKTWYIHSWQHIVSPFNEQVVTPK